MMTSLCFFVQLADRTLILSKGSFSVYIIATRLLLNHSPSEWFSYTKREWESWIWLSHSLFYDVYRLVYSAKIASTAG